MRGLQVLLAAVVACSAGCGGGEPKDKPTLAPVHGKLVQKGAPLANAMVEFMPDSGAPSTGTSDAQGAFELTYGDGTKGAKIGAHKVKVTVGGIIAAPMAPMDGSSTPMVTAPSAPPTLYLIPDPVQVKEGDNTLEITVPEKGRPG